MITFRDTGMGIPEHDIPDIFEKFYRVQQHGKELQGMGLGLAVTRKIIEKHCGRIWVGERGMCRLDFQIHVPGLMISHNRKVFLLTFSVK